MYQYGTFWVPSPAARDAGPQGFQVPRFYLTRITSISRVNHSRERLVSNLLE